MQIAGGIACEGLRACGLDAGAEEPLNPPVDQVVLVARGGRSASRRDRPYRYLATRRRRFLP